MKLTKLTESAINSGLEWCRRNKLSEEGGERFYNLMGITPMEWAVRMAIEDENKMNIDTTPNQCEVSNLSGNEWENGDECLYMNSSEVHKFIGIDPTRSDFCYIKANCSAVNWVETSKLTKPEFPQDREERERLEEKAIFIRDICLILPTIKISKAKAMYEAGYRKESR